MSTMYETIMSLPLIKGISYTRVSEFLEKTHIKFLGFSETTPLIAQSEECKYIYFIIKGRARITSPLTALPHISIRHTLTEGQLIGAENLFGLSTISSSDVSVEAGTNLLRLSKQNYFELLRSDNIYLLNFLNYLSAQSQKTREAAKLFCGASLRQRIAMWTAILTEPQSIDIEIKATGTELSAATGLTLMAIEHELESMELEKLIEIQSDRVCILSRLSLLESARESHSS